MSNQTVRTRFAPSPTGFLHVGGVRTALFAWLIAKQANGVFILRLEDTDTKREVKDADKHIIESLDVLGLKPDEGPYRQSERLDIYKKWAQKLVGSGRAYADPYTPQEVEAFRTEARQQKKAFLYRNHRPVNPPDWDGKRPLRFKADPKPYSWQDAVMGKLSTGPEVIDDFILLKSDGYPTYNFAHIIDDTEMLISHVIRGQEFLASVPNYLNLYEALELQTPVLATLPHILGPDGKKKLSKRDGAKDVLDYVRAGFLPETLINFIASLGWNDGTEQEIFSIQELLQKFHLNQVQRSGAHFDERRLAWMNGYYIRALSLEELYERVEQYWPKEASTYDKAYKISILKLVHDRLKYLVELPDLTLFFFKDLPVNLQLIDSHKQLGKLPKSELKRLLEQARTSLEKSDFAIDDLTKRLNTLLEETDQKPVILFSLIRIAVTQVPASPGLADTLSVLGKERSLKRILATLAALAS